MIGEPPGDFVGKLLALMLESQLDEEKSNDIKNWKMKIIVETNYYPVSITFDEGIIVQKGSIPDPTLRISFDMDTLVALVRRDQSPLKAILTGSIKMKGLIRHPIAALRFYRLMMSSIGG